MKGQFISDLQPGRSFSECVFVIRNVELKPCRNGSEYLTCNLADRSGSVAAKMWSVSEQQYRDACASPLVCVSGHMETGQYAGSVVIQTVGPVDVPEDLSDFLEPLSGECAAQQ